MNIKVKSTFIILFTMIIGIVIGFLGSNLVYQKRQKSLLELRKSRGFMAWQERIFEPTATQKDTLNKIFAKYHQHFLETSSRHRDEITAIVDSMLVELDPILTKEQRKRLSKRRDFLRFREREKRPFDRHPPDHMPGERPFDRPPEGKDKMFP